MQVEQGMVLCHYVIVLMLTNLGLVGCLTAGGVIKGEIRVGGCVLSPLLTVVRYSRARHVTPFIVWHLLGQVLCGGEAESLFWSMYATANVNNSLCFSNRACWLVELN